MAFLDALAQLGIFVSGFATAFLLTKESKRCREMAYIIGIAAEPFWLVATIPHSQWGMLLISFWYTGNFIYGYWQLRKNKNYETKGRIYFRRLFKNKKKK